jgi:hypothetical protein
MKVGLHLWFLLSKLYLFGLSEYQSATGGIRLFFRMELIKMSGKKSIKALQNSEGQFE